MSRRVECVHVEATAASPRPRLSVVLAAGRARREAPQSLDSLFKRTPKAPEPTIKEMVDQIRAFVASGEQSELKSAAEELMLLESRLSVNEEEAQMMGDLMSKQIKYLYSIMKLKQKNDASQKKLGR